MKPTDQPRFSALISDVFAFYRQDASQFAMNVWWQAMQPFDLAAVAEALNRHCVNPDSGQFMPKPADVVKMLRGSSQDSALVAWSKVDKAMRQVGPYQTVAFDDPVIHRVLEEMGGWIQLGDKTERDWPFIAKEFENRYRGYAMRNEIPEHSKVLIGITDANNQKQGFKVTAPVLIGDAASAKRVLLSGIDKPAIGFHRMEATEELPRLVAPGEK
ncbi:MULTISPECIES: DUF6475 domain-containing protein [unclassified Achromobacter]|uniref:DUF6475 domain-containing protein n=1 Tax=unclassified Achromobacter TaxID=2626865 RepID=UPI000B516148|nr:MULTISPECIES: DUF6475 domain-containing protein [unclassified Achromobacter]OWT68072.1 hypothetical protein CEY05_28990 [Achromobacter sp. HZ34]OWT69909.1 hypothetical protein CEY04_27820 [Achromobacter sp. HZ28]